MQTEADSASVFTATSAPASKATSLKLPQPTLNHTLLVSHSPPTASSSSSSSSSSKPSVLAVAVDARQNLLFSSSSHSEGIDVFDARTFLPLPQAPLRGHSSSILALELAPDRSWLFSASADGTVRIWDTRSLRCLYTILVQGDDPEDQDVSVGDVFALKWDSITQTLFLGCQNTSIRWCNLARLPSAKRRSASKTANGRGSSKEGRRTREEAMLRSAGATSKTPTSSPPLHSQEDSLDSMLPGAIPATALPIPRPHKFFDSDYLRQAGNANSYGSYSGSPILGFASTPSSPGTTTPDGKTSPWPPHPLTRIPSAQHPEISSGPLSPLLSNSRDTSLAENSEVRYIRLSSSCVIPNAHYGYVYALALLAPAPSQRSARSKTSILLASGSGDEDVKIWSFNARQNSGNGRLELLTTLSSGSSGEGGAVLSLANWQDTTLFVGKQSGSIEVWDLETHALLRTLHGHGQEDVLAMLATGVGGSSSSLFSAGADGYVCRHDASFKVTHRWAAHGPGGSVLSCALLPTSTSEHDELDEEAASTAAACRILTGGSDGTLRVWSLLVSPTTGKSTAGEQGVVKRAGFALESAEPGASGLARDRQLLSFDALLTALSDFVAFRSVSSDPNCQEESRQCAYWLKSHFSTLGAADSQILPGASGRNPLVLSVFEARGPQGRVTPRKRILFYGHYDVIGAVDAKGSWKSSPWTLSGRDGYLYGRGVSDNKGPILSVASAVHRLYARRQLDVDVVFLIEGEEEAGSAGFRECLENNKDKIGAIDTILLSNSYWLDEQTPCLTVGMRGVVQCTVTISKPGSKSSGSARGSPSDAPASVTGRGGARCDPYDDIEDDFGAMRINGTHDVHSGVQGGSLREPMIDMVQLLSHLSNGNRVLIPGFYDAVCSVSSAERQYYSDIVALLKRNSQAANATATETTTSTAIPTAESLMARWRFPSLSVHSISVSGSGNSTIIPAVVSSKISIRLVPHQSLEQIRDALESFLKHTFEKQLQSANVLEVSVGHEASWWVGDTGSEYTSALSQSIREAWDSPTQERGRSQTPQFNGSITENPKMAGDDGGKGLFPVPIREGGSIPAVSILETFLSSSEHSNRKIGAVHLPMGQSSDSAHLADERIRLLNLVKGREIVEAYLSKICAIA